MTVSQGPQRLQGFQISELDYKISRGEHSNLNIPAKILTKLQWRKMFKSKNPSQLHLKWVSYLKESQENGGMRATITLQKYPHWIPLHLWIFFFKKHFSSVIDKNFKRAPGFVQADPTQSSEQKSCRSWRQERCGKSGWSLVAWRCLVARMWGNELTAGNGPHFSIVKGLKETGSTFILQGPWGKHNSF